MFRLAIAVLTVGSSIAWANNLLKSTTALQTTLPMTAPERCSAILGAQISTNDLKVMTTYFLYARAAREAAVQLTQQLFGSVVAVHEMDRDGEELAAEFIPIVGQAMFLVGPDIPNEVFSEFQKKFGAIGLKWNFSADDAKAFIGHLRAYAGGVLMDGEGGLAPDYVSLTEEIINSDRGRMTSQEALGSMPMDITKLTSEELAATIQSFQSQIDHFDSILEANRQRLVHEPIGFQTGNAKGGEIQLPAVTTAREPQLFAIKNAPEVVLSPANPIGFTLPSSKPKQIRQRAP